MNIDLRTNLALSFMDAIETRLSLGAGTAARHVMEEAVEALFVALGNELPIVKFRFDKELWPSGGWAPAYAKPGDAAVDLIAAEDVDIAGGHTREVRTGLYVEIPPGYEGQVRPRSGLARKRQITVTNSPGTIDSSYRGPIIVLLTQHVSGPAYHLARGDRIAQLVISKVAQAQFVEVEELSETERGEGGFGSTGT